jgi:hypothetical protein
MASQEVRVGGGGGNTIRGGYGTVVSVLQSQSIRIQCESRITFISSFIDALQVFL